MTNNEIYLLAVRQLSERNWTSQFLTNAVQTLIANGATNLAADLYRRWTEADPKNTALNLTLYNSALMLRDRGDVAGAANTLARLVGLNPDFSPAQIGLGQLYDQLGEREKAIAQWTAMVDRPTVVSGVAVENTMRALKNICGALQANSQTDEFEAMLRRGLEIEPDQRQMIHNLASLRLSQCRWPITSAPDLDREAMLRRMGPFQLTLYTDDPMLHLASAWDYYKDLVGFHDPCPDVRPRAANPGRLRIGYLSADLNSHSTGYLITEVFELHDRSKLEVFAYDYGPAMEDPTKARIRAGAEHWVDINGMDDATAARRIAADGIDILIDLNGTTRGGRTRLVAMRPAPIIVNWLAYPGTLGSPYYHYIIADEWIIPKTHEIYYAEKVVRLPCYQPNDRKREIAPRPSREQAGLPADAMVYCCFNTSLKITRFNFDRWMTILSRVPGSVLWLLDGGAASRRHLVEYAGQRGIAADRLIFAPTLIRAHHLARYPLADLFLDTAPCGAHTTASDALWMGVPILTLPGHGFASRVCASLARAAGLPEAICKSPEEYVERAVALGQDKAKLQRQKERLASQRDTCLLFDMERLVRHLEGLYRQMWKEFHQGQRPRVDLRNLDVYFDVGVETDHDAVEMLAVKDYPGWYRERLARRHRRCAIPADSRLWTETDIARAEVVKTPARAASRKPPKSRARKPIAGAKKRAVRGRRP